MSVKPRLLRRCPPFSDLSDSDLEKLAARAHMQWFDRGDSVSRQGDPIGAVHAIVDGCVKLSRVTASGKVMVTDFLGPGELIGQRALLGASEHPDDVVAVEDTLVASLPSGVATRFLESDTDALLALSRHLGERLRHQERKVVALSTMRVHQRLAEGLLHLGRTLGVRRDGEIVVKARFTQAEIADWVGTTRETASTVLNELKRADIIDIVSRRLHLKDLEGLRLYAESEEPAADPAAARTSDRASSSVAEPAGTSA